CADLSIPGSKSETNRLLILRALYPNLSIQNASDSDDSRVLEKALRSSETCIDIGHAGTAMRFLTAYYAFGKEEKILTGSRRMQQRPIKILIDALRKLGADIQYLHQEGFPPLRISGKTPQHSKIEISAEVSSQYISALLLNAPHFPDGLQLQLKGKILSRPYIMMTLDLLNTIGIKTSGCGNQLRVFPKDCISPQSISVESDWSSASYFYSLAALSSTADIRLGTYRKN